MLLGVLIIFFVYSAFSADCESIRLDGPDGAMENVKHKDQGELGVFFSYAGTALFDAYQAKHGTGSKNQSSPLEAAAGTLQKRILNRTEITGSQTKEYADLDGGGSTCEVVNYLLENGGCPSESVSLEQLDSDQRGIYLQAVKELFYEDTISKKELSEKVQCHLPKIDTNLEQKLFPLMKLKKQINQKNFGEYLKSILSKQCSRGKRGRPLSGVECFEIPKPWQRKLDPEKYIPLTREHLLNRRQPVGISFCSNILRSDPWYMGRKRNEYQFETRESDCGLHEAIIIGMRKVNKIGGGGMGGAKCQYLIRNSWNKDVKYSPFWESENNGNVWVDEDSLFRNVEGLSLIKQK
jgi:hypothetical protein